MADTSNWPTIIRQLAARYGVDPRAALAVASVEGLSGGVGDGGHAFGPFQLNDAGGVITGRPGNHQAFAESPQGIDFAMRRIAQVAKGKTGQAAINAIVRQFERPAAPDAEVQRALAAYGNVKAPAGGAPSVPLTPVRASTGGTATDQTGAQKNPIAAQLLQSLIAQNSAFASGGKTAAVAPPTPLSLLTQPQVGQASPSPLGAIPGPSGAAPAGPPIKVTTSGRVKILGDTAGLKPKFLNDVLAAVTGSGGTQLKITSGYRSQQHNQEVGGATHSNHLTGDALDGYALVNGSWVPIGQLLAKTAGKYGLRSGSSFNWNGRPDTVHVDDFFNQGR